MVKDGPGPTQPHRDDRPPGHNPAPGWTIIKQIVKKCSNIDRDQRSLTATTARRVTIWRWDEPLCHKSLRNAQRSTGTNAASPSQQKIPIRTLITNHRDFIVGSSSFAFYLLLDHNPTLEAFWVAARRVTIQRQGEPLCNKSLRNG